MNITSKQVMQLLNIAKTVSDGVPLTENDLQDTKELIAIIISQQSDIMIGKKNIYPEPPAFKQNPDYMVEML